MRIATLPCQSTSISNFNDLRATERTKKLSNKGKGTLNVRALFLQSSTPTCSERECLRTLSLPCCRRFATVTVSSPARVRAHNTSPSSGCSRFRFTEIRRSWWEGERAKMGVRHAADSHREFAEAIAAFAFFAGLVCAFATAFFGGFLVSLGFPWRRTPARSKGRSHSHPPRRRLRHQGDPRLPTRIRLTQHFRILFQLTAKRSLCRASPGRRAARTCMERFPAS